MACQSCPQHSSRARLVWLLLVACFAVGIKGEEITSSATAASDVSIPGVTAIGCFKEIRCNPVSQSMFARIANRTYMTIESCIALAQAKTPSSGFHYAAVQAGTLCMAGTDISAYTVAGICEKPCGGNATQSCGGRCANYIYQFAPAPANYVGCFQEPGPCTSIPTSQLTFLGNLADLTQESCIVMAAEKGFRYAAMKFGTECYGGDDVSAYVAQGMCDKHCGGNRKQACGGTCNNSIFDVTVNV